MKWTTGEVAELCDITVRTVQYYDKKGLVKPSVILNNRRFYTEEELNQLRIVTTLKDMNFSLKEIKELLYSTQSIKTLNMLLDEKLLQLDDNIEHNKQKHKQIKFVKESISKESNYPVSNILNLRNKSEEHQKMQNFRKKFMGISIGVGVIQYSSILMAILKKKWKPIIIVYPFIILYAVIASKLYYEVVQYVCPNCQRDFKPKFSEWFTSNHTYQTRKLKCPKCGVESYCLEIYK